MRCFKYLFTFLFLLQAQAGITIISNKKSNIVDRDEFISILRGERLGYNIYINSESMEYVLKNILNIELYEFNKNWGVLVFTGRASAPMFLENNEDVVKAIQKDLTSVGVIKSRTSLEDVRIDLKL